MLKKVITYTDLDGAKQELEAYFHLSKAEVVELEASESGGMSKFLETIVKSNNKKLILETFKKIVLLSYGVKSADGQSFIKSDALRESFANTIAFHELYYQLYSDAEVASAFVNGIMPQIQNN